VVEEGAPQTAAVRRELRQMADGSRERFVGGQGGGRGAVWDSADLARAKGAAPSAPMREPRDTAAGGRNESGIAAPDTLVLGVSSGSTGPGGRYDEKRAERLDAELRRVARELIHRVAGKTFYAKADGLWVDSAYNEKTHGKPEEVTLWSKEFLELARTHRDLGKFVTAHQNLIILFDGKAYRVR
jgi:hypothetical protein